MAASKARLILSPMSQYDILFAVFAFVLGSAIGSFLNVCIYRMPLDLSVNEPRRSFCPNCKYQIPWWNNLPLISWLKLGGKCANCGQKIAFRYFGVELLTGVLFLAVWLHVWPGQWILALPLWVMISLFVVATFIDFEHFIIPDEITWGGAAAGVVCSLAVPLLHGVTSPLEGGMWAVIGGASGYFLLWGVVEAGKLAFGKKRIVFEKPESFSWVRENDDADFVLGEDKERWSEMFRPKDRLLLKCPEVTVGKERFENADLEFHYDRLRIGSKEWALINVDTIAGTVLEATIPREAMGFGDVKFMACIGAFLGWKAVLFTVAAASCIGAVVGLATIVIGKREWSAKIPFGPYLSLGALVWTFQGPQLVAWYWALSHAGGGGQF
jgi:leader peptidase (prepilin peptidase) / N-methyltransferase